MVVLWKIRFLNRSSRIFDDRTMLVDTQSLGATERAALELTLENSTSSYDRSILRYRHLFKEVEMNEIADDMELLGRGRIISVTDYVEDENGKEITEKELGPALTGDPNARIYRNPVRAHDIKLEMAEPKPIPLDGISIDGDDLRLLGYFERDLRELTESAFFKEGSGTIEARGSFTSSEAPEPILKTAVSDDEIRSAVTIFRRLYMANEPANLAKAVAILSRVLVDHPLAEWVDAEAEECSKKFEQPVNFLPFAQGISFTRKRLIDVFLYTQYHHQPDERRQRQYGECLSEVNGKKQMLTFMFLTELHHACLDFSNTGKFIGAWFRRYVEHNNISPDVIPSLRHDNPHLGVVEKKTDRNARLFREKTQQLAIQMWTDSGCPESGPDPFMANAENELKRLMDN